MEFAQVVFTEINSKQVKLVQNYSTFSAKLIKMNHLIPSQRHEHGICTQLRSEKQTLLIDAKLLSYQLPMLSYEEPFIITEKSKVSFTSTDINAERLRGYVQNHRNHRKLQKRKYTQWNT